MFDVFKSVGRKFFGRRSPRLSCDRTYWLQNLQEEEFEWHRNDHKRRNPEKWRKRNVRLLDHFGFSPSQFEGKTLIDLGAGSLLRTTYFIDAQVIAIDPLAERYRLQIPWCDLGDAEEVHSVAGEERVESCSDRADLIVSINMFDQCYDCARVLENIHLYAKEDATIFLSFDKGIKVDAMHPLELDEEICEALFVQQGFRIVEFTRGTDGILARDAYGRGPYCLNYTLQKSKSFEQG